MTYVMADLHGRYDLYQRMLEKIAFSPQDTLYILGDLCDRGPQSAALLLDVMERENVVCLMGNHEEMARRALVYLYRDPEYVGPVGFPHVSLWFSNGGEETFHSLFEPEITAEQREKVLQFLRRLPLYLELEVEGKNYFLCHTVSPSFDGEFPAEAYDEQAFLWSRPRDFNATLRLKGVREGTRFIFGHTPTFLVGPRTPRMLRGKGNLINVDCGAAYEEQGGRLGCLCLENGAGFYVSSRDDAL